MAALALTAAAAFVRARRRATVYPQLPPGVSGDRQDMPSAAGRLSLYSAGPTPATAIADPVPLLLIHSINAAGSAYETRPLYEFYRQTRSVYAVELPGFGFSERPQRIYTPRQMTDAVLAAVDFIRRKHGCDRIDAVAISLSCEFLARAAGESPGAFRTLFLISPTGFGSGTPREAPSGKTAAKPLLRNFFTVPLWSKSFFELLSSRVSIRFFLQKTWGSKNIDEGLLEYDYLTTHQPGAEHAPYCFVSGYLFSKDIRGIYRSLAMPVLMLHGTRGDFTDYRHKDEVAGKLNWDIEVMDTGAMPHFERLADVTRVYDEFMAAADHTGRQ